MTQQNPAKPPRIAQRRAAPAPQNAPGNAGGNVRARSAPGGAARDLEIGEVDYCGGGPTRSWWTSRDGRGQDQAGVRQTRKTRKTNVSDGSVPLVVEWNAGARRALSPCGEAFARSNESASDFFCAPQTSKARPPFAKRKCRSGRAETREKSLRMAARRAVQCWKIREIYL